ncbi:MAG: RNA polymerase factor sigma-54 [Desulfuromonadaceae bacterium]|nr:RNA polymerase factor sigma-54 [Desulfuromonadaceae bacterium]
MALELRQQLKLSQQLVMTPQLQQAIKLLQLSRVELEEVVEQELEENPVLEKGDSLEVESDTQERTKEEAAEEAARTEDTAEVGEPDDLGSIEDWQTYLQGYTQGGSIAEGGDEDLPAYDNTLRVTETLQAHLLWQLQLGRYPEDVVQAAGAILGNLDEAGYLCSTLDELCHQFHISEDLLVRALEVVQQLDPPGVGARNLSECLHLQLKSLGLEGSLADILVTQYSAELETRRYNVIARKCKVTEEEVYSAARVLRELDPYPGSVFANADVQYITPDVFVHKKEDDYIVTLNDDGLANLGISSYYANIVKQKLDEKTSEYLQEKMRGAQWLLKSIYQRQKTIYRVTVSIVKFQREFFDKGISYLKPLVLRDVAEDIEMHESTISRVTTNKYLQAPQGLFELKYFFNSGIGTSTGEDMAATAVKSRIQDIVAAENSQKPYSDQKIVKILAEEGINIARRTVTKYREMLGIRSSTARKRYF